MTISYSLAHHSQSAMDASVMDGTLMIPDWLSPSVDGLCALVCVLGVFWKTFQVTRGTDNRFVHLPRMVRFHLVAHVFS